MPEGQIPQLHIWDNDGKVSQDNYKIPNQEENSIEKNENSESDRLSNLSSSTEIEQDTKEHNLRRSKRATKTNLIVRPNNTVPSEYRKYSQSLIDRQNTSDIDDITDNS